MKVSITASFKPNAAYFDRLDEILKQSVEQTGESILGDIRLSQTMPFRTGELQNNKTFVDYSKASEGIISIKHEGPYARRLYFHPEFNFNQSINAHAGGRWLDPYLKGGAKAHLVRDYFVRHLRRNLGT